jgi:molecular chaperone IbpA
MTREISLRSLDIPNIHKFGIGFENIFDEIMRLSASQHGNYPPHNVIKTGVNTVTIEVAVAGFDEGEISVLIENRILVITGEQSFKDEPTNYEYYHRGLSRRNFTQKFPLNEHVEVIEANIKNGVLTVYLERKIPEDKLPKKIAINYNK